MNAIHHMLSEQRKQQKHPISPLGLGRHKGATLKRIIPPGQRRSSMLQEINSMQNLLCEVSQLVLYSYMA